MGQRVSEVLGVLKKFVLDPPATASLRWLLIYRIFQKKYTCEFAKKKSNHNKNEMCKSTLSGISIEVNT